MKTKLGIGFGLAACLCYLIGFFFGSLALVVVAGYVLLCEDNAFVRNAAIKALGITLFFSVVSALINLIPNVFDIFNYIGNIFEIGEKSFNSLKAISKINQILGFIKYLLDICEKLVMLFLAYLAVRMRTLKFPVVDGLISKFVTLNKTEN